MQAGVRAGHGAAGAWPAKGRHALAGDVLLRALACWGINASCRELLPQSQRLTPAAVPRVSRRSLISLPTLGTPSPPKFSVSPAPTHILNETLTYSVPPRTRVWGSQAPPPPCPQHVTMPFSTAGRGVPQGVLR